MTNPGAIITNWSSYTSPAGFFSIKYPSDWKINRQDNIVNICPPDMSGAVTISAFHGVFSLDIVRNLIIESYHLDKDRFIFRIIERNGWKGIESELSIPDGGSIRQWKINAAILAKTMVLVTATDKDMNKEDRAEIYHQIFSSLFLFSKD
jgi:hypothetical protein